MAPLLKRGTRKKNNGQFQMSFQLGQTKRLSAVCLYTQNAMMRIWSQHILKRLT